MSSSLSNIALIGLWYLKKDIITLTTCTIGYSILVANLLAATAAGVDSLQAVDILPPNAPPVGVKMGNSCYEHLTEFQQISLHVFEPPELNNLDEKCVLAIQNIWQRVLI